VNSSRPTDSSDKRKKDKKPLREHNHRDVVIDTNVLAHSHLKRDPNHPDAVAFVSWVANEEDLLWVFDDHGGVAPEFDTSVLLSEYHETLSKQSSAYLLFLNVILRTERYCWANRPGQHTRELIRKMVPRNKRDRAILGGAVGCGNHWLVSNDYDDFTDDVRDECLDRFGVQVTHCSERVA
jgi:hypothetical protein